MEVSLYSLEQLLQDVRPHLSLLLVADSSQRLRGVNQSQHCSLKVLPAQRLPSPAELRCQAPDVGQLLGQDVLADDFQPINAPEGSQLLIWDQQGLTVASDLRSSQQNLRETGPSTT